MTKKYRKKPVIIEAVPEPRERQKYTELYMENEPQGDLFLIYTNGKRLRTYGKYDLEFQPTIATWKREEFLNEDDFIFIGEIK